MFSFPYPHKVELLEKRLVSDSYKTGQVFDWVVKDTFKAKLDTPRTSEQLKYYQMEVQYDLDMYTPYSITLKRTNRVRHDGVIYEIVAEPSNQGGEGRINKTMLSRIPNG